MESRNPLEKPIDSTLATVGIFAKSSAEKKESKAVIAQRKIRSPITEKMIYANMSNGTKITDAIAKEFKLDRHDIQRGELFETSVIRYVFALNSHAVPNLTAETDISHNATYAATDDTILIRYDQFNKEQVIAIAKVLEQHFADVDTVIIPNEPRDKMFWLGFDRNVFLKDVLPKLLTKVVPEKIAQPATPFLQLESYKSSMFDFGVEMDENGFQKGAMRR